MVLLTCSYRTAEFIRIGYYVSNDYTDPDMKENNPSPPKMDQLQRNILATNPRSNIEKKEWRVKISAINLQNLIFSLSEFPYYHHLVEIRITFPCSQILS